MTLRRIAALAALLSLLAAAVIRAQDRTPAETLEHWEREATRAEEVLEAGEASTSALEVLRETLVSQRAAAREMVAAEEKKLEPLRQQLDALGPPPEDPTVQEAPEVAAARTELNQKIETASGQKTKAELALARADALIKELDGIIRARFTGMLLSIGPSPLPPWRWINAAAEYRNVGDRLVREAAGAFNDPVVAKVRESRLPALVIATIFSLVLVVWVRRILVRAARRGVVSGASRGRRLIVGLATAAMRLFSPLIVLALFLVALQQSGVVGPTGYRLQPYLIDGLVAIILGYGLGLVLFSPASPELRLAAVTDEQARRGARLSGLLGFVIFLESFLVRGGADVGLAASPLAVANLPIVVLGAFFLFRFARLIRPRLAEQPEEVHEEDSDAGADHPPRLGQRALRALSSFMSLAAVLSPILAAVGYFAASRYVLFPTIVSVGLLAGALIVFIAIREAVDAYVEEQEVESPGLRLLSVMLGFLVACAALPVLALIWGARVADLSEWWLLFAEGLSLGDVKISPIDFLTFAVVFSIGYSVTRLLQGFLRGSVLPNTRLDSGARVAIVSGAGYVGYIVAALAAIAATGLDLSNVAIVAGALSVGIGFGLQNIVNNFVSGVILLIERPIKAGDWIEAGGFSGYVKNVSVRATQIETFDRSTVIMPNSELISGSVLNYTHRGTVGRVIVSVGVAYGSDTRKVEKILDEVARSSPLVLRRPAPFIYFKGFGADSLDFEIRAYLRDVNNVLAARSDMNHEITKRFGEEGVEVPFAQRDVHIRDSDALARSIAMAVRGEGSADDDGTSAVETPPEPEGENRTPARRGERASPAARPDDAAGDD